MEFVNPFVIGFYTAENHYNYRTAPQKNIKNPLKAPIKTLKNCISLFAQHKP